MLSISGFSKRSRVLANNKQIYKTVTNLEEIPQTQKKRKEKETPKQKKKEEKPYPGLTCPLRTRYGVFKRACASLILSTDCDGVSEFFICFSFNSSWYCFIRFSCFILPGPFP